jgi:hypothetical protein
LTLQLTSETKENITSLVKKPAIFTLVAVYFRTCTSVDVAKNVKKYISNGRNVIFCKNTHVRGSLHP